MKVGDPTHPRILSIMWTECSFLNSMNLYLVVVISEHFPVDCLLLQASCSEPSK